MSSLPPELNVVFQYLPYLVPILLIQWGLLLYALVDVIRRERVRYLPKWAWILIVAVVNIIGPLVYLLIGRED
ncbi:MAG: PLD nuclease N-terminal domain-containing protein [Anaerolineae bacterium]